MQKEIKYIGFYDTPNSKHKRVSTYSAVNKMNYIAQSIQKTGLKVNFISPSWYDDSVKNAPYQSLLNFENTDKTTVTFLPTFGTSTKFGGYLKIVFSLVGLFFWLIFNTKKNEKIILYHTPWLALPVLLAKKIKGFYLILEVEEVYSDVSSLHPYFDTLEKKIFKKSDSFLLSTELLKERIGVTKPFIVIYGNYDTYKKIGFPPADGKIHVIYAGIIDTIKAGAFNAVESALFLTELYVIHVIGFGEVDVLKSRIEEINKVSKCKIIFDGSKQGNEFIKYCQECHIGLSTQSMVGKYLETSFPSKILSYLGMGLRVISGEISCVKTSKINSIMHYYKEDSPQAIAKALLSVNIDNNYDSKKVMEQLDSEFIADLKKMIHND